ncbi:TPA: prephenate dehydratase domain-containing protein [Vibrio parahaemolyticus]|uniref:prephenate dehydratase domain-containing protein n=1 Tax=Vibrio parahaemolyticus TaxID=670 RepID=UPI001D93F510|nr:prephenate dehydratase domain-containing protein [Vibrio parahaemolyticus]EGQ8919478.1 prephenate dehydratase [Vibrio parahaemolyticus]EHH1101626.1 prephenate dehydratase [Vibrio parahaemolyticus]MCG9644983.1 prephenate dehydratase [Vibrio parahaemolyticus]HCE2382693.1 prephenate dehydratase [Vibrio parahaemolyticus]
MLKPLGIAIAASTLMFSTLTTASESVFAQASRGSFNDAAITKLFEQQPSLSASVTFAGTPSNTFQQSIDNSALAFSAVENSTIDGRLVQATVEAFQQYRLLSVKAFIETPIEMCVLMNQQDVANDTAITMIVSHPAALKQINAWKAGIQPKELEIPEGTAAAAKLVADRELPTGTAAIGACVLDTVYTNLKVVEKGVQDNKNNKTSFLLMKVEPREQTISEAEARKELSAAIEMGKKLAKVSQ